MFTIFSVHKVHNSSTELHATTQQT